MDVPGKKQWAPSREIMTPSPNAWDGNPSTSSRTPSLVAKPTLRSIQKARASTVNLDLSLMVVSRRVGTSRSPRTRDPNPVRGHRTTTRRISGSRTRRVHGAVINGTKVGPSTRNRDSTGSLSVLREGHPTTPKRRTQQTNLHQFRWCPTRLTCWETASSSCPALMALQQDPWRCNSSSAHCGRSLHGKLTPKQFQCLGATSRTSSTVVTFSMTIGTDSPRLQP